MILRFLSTQLIIANHKSGTMVMVLHSFLETRKLTLIMEGMDTSLTIVIGNMTFLPTLVKKIVIANHYSLELNEEREDFDNSES